MRQGLCGSTPQQQEINNLYKESNEGRYVLFITDKKSSTGQKGYFRLNGQFGYIFGNPDEKTPAHEVGHGVFKLEHPSSTIGTTQGKTKLLLDYGNGTALSHLDWKQINDPKLKIYMFQGQNEGEIAEKIWFTPNWKPFTVKGSSTILSLKNYPKGTVPGFAWHMPADALACLRGRSTRHLRRTDMQNAPPKHAPQAMLNGLMAKNLLRDVLDTQAHSPQASAPTRQKRPCSIYRSVQADCCHAMNRPIGTLLERPQRNQQDQRNSETAHPADTLT